MIRLNRYFFLVNVTLGVLIGGVMACYVIPRHTGSTYLAELQTATRTLDRQMRVQTKLADMDFLGDIALAPAQFYSQSAAARAGTEKTIRQLAGYEKVCQQLPAYGSWAVADAYRQAVVAQQRCRAMVTQSTAVLHTFTALITYTETQKTKDAVFVAVTTEFNKVKDLNLYAGHSNELYAQATKLKQLADDPLALIPPAAVAGLPAAFATVYRDAAAGFEQVAYGIVVAQDSPIYTGAKMIETAVAKHDQDLGLTYTSMMDGSLILADVRDLSEKLSLTI